MINEYEISKFANISIDKKHEANKLLTSDELFDYRFNNLKNYFTIPNMDSVYEFIRENEKFFELVDDIKPLLDEYFCGYDFSLYVNQDPIYFDFKLNLVINVDYSSENHDELIHRFMDLLFDINPFKVDLGFAGKFITTLEEL